MGNEVTQQQIIVLKRRIEEKKMELVKARTQLEHAEEQVRQSEEKLKSLGVTPETVEGKLSELRIEIANLYNELVTTLQDVEKEQEKAQWR